MSMYSFQFRAWNSYLEQIRLINEFGHQNKTLMVGIVDGLITPFFRNQGYAISSLDIEEKLNPDYCMSIEDLSSLNEEFDLICCFEVLEHLSFEKIELILSELSRKGKRVIISLPRSNFFINLEINNNFSRSPLITLVMPFNKKKSEAHEWEINSEDKTRLKNLIKIFKKFFKVEREYILKENPHHHFFVLKSKVIS